MAKTHIMGHISSNYGANVIVAPCEYAGTLEDGRFIELSKGMPTCKLCLKALEDYYANKRCCLSSICELIRSKMTIDQKANL